MKFKEYYLSEMKLKEFGKLLFGEFEEFYNE